MKKIMKKIQKVIRISFLALVGMFLLPKCTLAVEVNNEEDFSKAISAGEDVTLTGSFEVYDGELTVLNTSSEVVEIDEIISKGTFTTDVCSYVKSGYACKKILDNYVVGIENNINVSSLTNGSVTLDKTKALVGEAVTIIVSPKTGYELLALKVVDKDNKEVEVNNNTFVMPDSNVTVSAEFSKVTKEAEVPVIDLEEEVVVGAKDSEKINEVLLDSLLEDEVLSEIGKLLV